MHTKQCRLVVLAYEHGPLPFILLFFTNKGSKCSLKHHTEVGGDDLCICKHQIKRILCMKEWEKKHVTKRHKVCALKREKNVLHLKLKTGDVEDQVTWW